MLTQWQIIIILYIVICISLLGSYLYNRYFRRNTKNFLEKISTMPHLDKIKIKTNRFLKTWFNIEKKQYFPQQLFHIFRIKRWIDPYLMELTYPIDLFQSQDLMDKYFPEFKNVFIQKTYRYFNMKKFKFL